MYQVLYIYVNYIDFAIISVLDEICYMCDILDYSELGYKLLIRKWIKILCEISLPYLAESLESCFHYYRSSQSLCELVIFEGDNNIN